jgi:ribosomal protein L40E
VSLATIRAGYIIGFVVGVTCILLGIYLICLQFFKEGYVINSSSDPYAIFAGWATFGVISLGVGALLIYNTYQILIPLQENNFTTSRACSNCGAIIAESAKFCEKCGQQMDTSDFEK